MKSKLAIISITSIVAASILFYVFIIKYNKKLPELPNYQIVSNTGQSIPAKLYSRTVNTKIGSNEQEIDQFIICFDDLLVLNELNASGDDKVYKFLVISPELKMIGLINNMTTLQEKDGYIYQSSHEADNFTSIINNFTFFTNPPIKEATITADRITFNAFGILKQYGDNVIIEIAR